MYLVNFGQVADMYLSGKILSFFNPDFQRLFPFEFYEEHIISSSLLLIFTTSAVTILTVTENTNS